MLYFLKLQKFLTEIHTTDRCCNHKVRNHELNFRCIREKDVNERILFFTIHLIGGPYLRTHATAVDTFPASDVANALSSCARTCTGGCGIQLMFQLMSRVSSLIQLNALSPMWQSQICFDNAAASIKAQAPGGDIPHE